MGWAAGRGGKPGDFTGNELRGVDFSKRVLREAKFVRADCEGASFAAANLVRTDFFGANLGNANLSDSDLTGANLRGVSL